MATLTTSFVSWRWMTKEDMPVVVKMEKQSEHENPWTDEIFYRYLGRRSRGVMLAIEGKKIVGYIAFDLAKKRALVANMLVAKPFRRRGIGSFLFDKLAEGLKKKKVFTHLEIYIRESDLASQIFLRAAKFRCENIVPTLFDLPPEAGYHFRRALT